MARKNDDPSDTNLDALHVSDAMHHGVVSCAADVPLMDVAQQMASQRIHCIVVQPAQETDEPRAWGVVSDLDLVGAIDMPDVSAGAVAATPTVTVAVDDSINRAAKLMSEYETAHLLVLDAAGQPSGVISTLDIARAMSGQVART